MTRTEQIVFIAAILGFALFWSAIVSIGIPKEQRKAKKKKFDERQRIEQGRAFQYAYLVLIGYLLAALILNQGFGIVLFDAIFGTLLGIGFSVSTFFAYCIFRDAYFSVNESKPVTLVLINFSALLQFFIGITALENGEVFQNGMITKKASPFVFVLIFISIDVFVLIRKRLDKRTAVKN